MCPELPIAAAAAAVAAAAAAACKRSVGPVSPDPAMGSASRMCARAESVVVARALQYSIREGEGRAIRWMHI